MTPARRDNKLWLHGLNALIVALKPHHKGGSHHSDCPSTTERMWGHQRLGAYPLQPPSRMHGGTCPHVVTHRHACGAQEYNTASHTRTHPFVKYPRATPDVKVEIRNVACCAGGWKVK